MASELRDRYADMGDVVADFSGSRVETALGRGNGKESASKDAAGSENFDRPSYGLGFSVLRGDSGIGLAALAQGCIEKTGSKLSNSARCSCGHIGNLYVAEGDTCTIRKITPSGVVNTLAGMAGTPGIVDGEGSNAQFSILRGVAVDSAGNLYVPTPIRYERSLRPVVVSTFAGKVWGFRYR